MLKSSANEKKILILHHTNAFSAIEMCNGIITETGPDKHSIL